MDELNIIVEKFVWRFKDISRESCGALAAKFDQIVKTGSSKSDAVLDEQGMARLFEAMGDAKPITEIRAGFKLFAVAGVKPKTIDFLKVCCIFFEKDYDEFHQIPEEELKRLALESALKKSRETEELEASLKAHKLLEEEAERARAEQLEKESQLTGIAAKQAFFQRQAVSMPSNADQIKKEAKIRLALKEAKKKEEEEAAEMAAAGISPEKAQEKLREAMEKKLAAEDEARRVAEEEEAEARTRRKAVHSAKWDKPVASAGTTDK